MEKRLSLKNTRPTPVTMVPGQRYIKKGTFKTISQCYQQQPSLGLRSLSDDHTRQTYYFLSTRARVRIINILLTSVCSALPPQLPVPVALFPLDGTYGTKEINGRQPDGIPYGVKLAPGPDGEKNGSYEFSGKSHIKFPNNGMLDIKHSFTLLAWLQTFNPNSIVPVVAYYSMEKSRIGVVMGIFYEKFLFQLSNRNFLFGTNTSAVVADTWYYVGQSYDNDTGNAALYLDGKVIGTAHFPNSTPHETRYPLIAGYLSDEYNPFDGRIAWIQLYDVALSVEQVEAVKHFTGKSTGKNWLFYYNISCACKQYVHTIFTMSMIEQRKLCCLVQLLTKCL